MTVTEVFREGTIIARNVDLQRLYMQEVTSDKERADFMAQCGQSVPTYSWLKASFLVVRLDNLCDFAADLFLPTFINQALVINDMVGCIVLGLLAAVWDIATLLPRTLLLPVRFCLYCAEEEHPLLTLVKQEEQCRSTGRVLLEVRTIHDNNEENSDTEWISRAHKLCILTKPLPAFNNNEEEHVRIRQTDGDVTRIYKKINGATVSCEEPLPKKMQ